MTSYSNEICGELPTTLIVTQYMIKFIGNQIVLVNVPLLEVSSCSEYFCLTNYYVALNVNMMI